MCALHIIFCLSYTTRFLDATWNLISGTFHVNVATVNRSEIYELCIRFDFIKKYTFDH